MHLSLAGGTTPRAAYERLATLVDDWEGVELWLGDERLVPPDDPESNYRLVAETLLQGGAPAHAVPTGGSAEEAASAYAREIRRRVPAGPDGVPELDLALLGLGEDGHVASLFPHAPALDARGEVCVAVHDAPKPPPDRVSLTLDVLRAARSTIVLAVGEGKARRRGGGAVRSRSGRARQPARGRGAGADPGPGRRPRDLRRSRPGRHRPRRSKVATTITPLTQSAAWIALERHLEEVRGIAPAHAVRRAIPAAASG